MININDINDALKAKGVDPETGSQLSPQTGAQPAISQSNSAGAVSPAQNIGQNTGIIDKIANSAPTNFVLGAGDALARQMTDVTNLIPGVNLNVQPKSSGLAYGTGNIAGNLAGFLGGGEALGFARGASEALPLVGQLAKSLAGGGIPGIARRAIGSGIGGAITDPEDRMGGALTGAALSGGLDVAGAGLSKAISSVSPSTVVEKISDLLSPSSINIRKKMGGELYDQVFSQVPEKSIYENVSQQLPTNTNDVSPRNYMDLINSTDPGRLNKIYGSKISELNNLFVSNPTAQNAHSLQQALGEQIGKLNLMEDKMGALPSFEGLKRDSLSYSRNLIKNDMNNFFTTQSPDIAQQYANATENWKQNVVPYRNLSLALAALGKNPTPERILSKISSKQYATEDAFERSGRQQYFPPEISALLPQLAKKIQARDLTQKGIGALLGGAMGSGIGPGAEFATGAAGLYVIPKLAQALSGIIPSGKSLTGTSDILKKLILSSVLNRGQ
jgi:hypothetical protein